MSTSKSPQAVNTARIFENKSDPKTPPDLLMFRYNRDRVYVKVAKDHEEALDIATKEFDQLRNVPRDQIGFWMLDHSNLGSSHPRYIRISDDAWPSFVSGLPHGAVIDVDIRPGPEAKLPQYLEVPRATHSQSENSAVTSRSSSRTSTKSDKSVKSNSSAKSTSDRSPRTLSTYLFTGRR